MHHNYETKQKYNQSKSNIQVKVAQLEQAVNNERSLRIYYKSPAKPLTVNDIRPFKIVHVTDMDRYYLISIDCDMITLYRVDRIKRYEFCKKKLIFQI